MYPYRGQIWLTTAISPAHLINEKRPKIFKRFVANILSHYVSNLFVTPSCRRDFISRLWKSRTPSPECPDMTLNCIRWWSSSSRALGSAQYPFAAIIPRFTDLWAASGYYCHSIKSDYFYILKTFPRCNKYTNPVYGGLEYIDFIPDVRECEVLLRYHYSYIHYDLEW